VQAEDELDALALLRDAQQRAAKWGAERFAEEFRKRELHERWLEAERFGTTPYAQADEQEPATPGDALSGPVDATAHDRLVGVDRSEWRLTKQRHARHPSVPRPPAAEPEERTRRGRRRRRERAAQAPAPWLSPAEVAGMSAAARRLYGLDDTAA
jgi:hypothetical protein